MGFFTAQFGIEPWTTILLVEDDPDDQALFCVAARKSCLSLRIQAVQDGQDAIDYLEGNAPFSDRAGYPLPEAVALDLRLPKVNGFAFLRWLRMSSGFSALPVVILTGWLRSGWEEEAEALGVSKYFEKSSHVAELTGIVRQIWELGSLGGAAAEASLSRVAAPGSYTRENLPGAGLVS